MKCSIMLHFIWVFTICQSPHLGFSSILRVNIYLSGKCPPTAGLLTHESLVVMVTPDVGVQVSLTQVLSLTLVMRTFKHDPFLAVCLRVFLQPLFLSE